MTSDSVIEIRLLWLTHQIVHGFPLTSYLHISESINWPIDSYIFFLAG